MRSFARAIACYGDVALQTAMAPLYADTKHTRARARPAHARASESLLRGFTLTGQRVYAVLQLRANEAATRISALQGLAAIVTPAGLVQV